MNPDEIDWRRFHRDAQYRADIIRRLQVEEYRRNRGLDPARGGLLIHTIHAGQVAVAPTTPKEDGMTLSPFDTDPRSELEKQREALQAQLDRTLAKISALEKLPDLDASPDESVVLWKRTYRGVGDAAPGTPAERTYTYVAIKQDGRWFTTAAKGDCVFTSAELAEKHLIRADEVWVATGWAMPEAGEPIEVPGDENSEG